MKPQIPVSFIPSPSMPIYSTFYILDTRHLELNKLNWFSSPINKVNNVTPSLLPPLDCRKTSAACSDLTRHPSSWPTCSPCSSHRGEYPTAYTPLLPNSGLSVCSAPYLPNPASPTPPGRFGSKLLLDKASPAARAGFLASVLVSVFCCCCTSSCLPILLYASASLSPWCTTASLGKPQGPFTLWHVGPKVWLLSKFCWMHEKRSG